MSEASLIRRFEVGDSIPSWLLDVEPMFNGAVREKLDFTQPTDVIETDTYFAVLPVTIGQQPPLITFKGEGCRLVAPTKEVRCCMSQMVVACESASVWSPAKIEAPRTFWQRVKAVFRP